MELFKKISGKIYTSHWCFNILCVIDTKEYWVLLQVWHKVQTEADTWAWFKGILPPPHLTLLVGLSLTVLLISLKLNFFIYKMRGIISASHSYEDKQDRGEGLN